VSPNAQILTTVLPALKSTGPATPEGKQRSCCDAVRQGLTAETVIGGLEDTEDYQAFEATVIADYDAQAAVERELVLRLTSVLWRLRRATGIETSLFEFVRADPSKSDGEQNPTLITSANEFEQDQPPLDRVRQITGRFGNDAYLATRRTIGDRFLRLTTLPTFPLDRLSRYEQTLWRQARQIALTLEMLRRQRPRSAKAAFPFSIRSAKP